MRKWADYYNNPAARDKVRNVISLEISGTKLADKVMPPRIVRELDWVEKFWPATKKGKGHQYPKVQLYCLMGVAGAWTVSYQLFAVASSASSTSPGLAYRFCWLISVLPYFDWLKGGFALPGRV